MTKIKQLFNNLIQYENKIPGIAEGLEILRFFDNIKESVAQKNEVKYYNFVDDCFYYYSFDDLNQKMQQLIIDLKQKKLKNNYLYNVFFQKLVDTNGKFNYKYMNNNVNEHTLLRKLFHGFRINLKKNYEFSFFLSEVIKIFPCSYFVSTVSPDDFYVFVIEYFKSLTDVLFFDSENGFIGFFLFFFDDLQRLMFLNMDYIFLGEKKEFSQVLDLSSININLESIYQKYLVSDFGEKCYIEGYIFWYVLCSTTDVVSFHTEFNNTFLEKK